MTAEDRNLTITNQFALQLDACYTSLEVSRAILRNFVGHFLPEKAAFYLAPNAFFPFLKCIDKYNVDVLPEEISGKGAIVSLTRHLSGATLITEGILWHMAKSEQEILSQFQYLMPFANQSHYAGVLLFSMHNNKILETNGFDGDYLKLISVKSAKTLHSFVKPVDLHLDKTTKLFSRDYLYAIMDHYKHIARELVHDNSASLAMAKNTIIRKSQQNNQNEKENLQIWYSIILLKIINLDLLNSKFGFEKGNNFLYQLAHELKVLLRRSDVPARYGGSQFIILLPFTYMHEAELLKNELEKILTIVKKKLFIPDDLPLEMKLGFASFPTDGEESYLLIRAAEKISL